LVEEPLRCCPFAPQALKAAWRAELFPPAAPAKPAGGGATSPSLVVNTPLLETEVWRIDPWSITLR
jgi:hypothetical protein